MARTPTTAIPLGFQAPYFELLNVQTGTATNLNEVKGEKGTVVMFICNHCPFVVHVLDGILELAKEYQSKGFGFVAISSNDVQNYPDDSPENMKTLADEKAFPFPYLYDESQTVAKAYTAACTPDFSLFDGALKCVYRGQMDGARPGSNVPVTGEDLRKAMECILANRSIDFEQKPSLGCNIKWK